MEYKKKRGDRRDGRWLKDLDPLHQFFPYIYPNRADNEAFIQERIDLTNLNAYLDKKNAENPENKYTFFQVLLSAIVKTMVLRPKMNRFIKGHREYERNVLSAGFVVKKQFSDEGKEALAFITFPEDSTMETVREKIYAEITSCRGEGVDNSTDGMDMLTKMPRFLLRIVMGVLNFMDYHGIVPNSLIKADPNHASVFITNLGSIGLKAGYHHLMNWGTNSVFVIIGEMKKTPFFDENGFTGLRDTVDIGLTLDERIADGYYYSKTVKLLKFLLQNPELLELPAMEEVEYDK